MSHLGACGPCAAMYAELIRTAPAAQPAHFNAADFVERGYAVRRKAAAPMWKSWKVLAPALTVAAALILVVSIGRGTSDDVRGARIELSAPVAEVGRPIALEWSSGLAAPRFTVNVKDASGVVLFSSTTTATRATIPADVSAKITAGRSYSWTVSALDADGQVIAHASGSFSPGAR